MEQWTIQEIENIQTNGFVIVLVTRPCTIRNILYLLGTWKTKFRRLFYKAFCTSLCAHQWQQRITNDNQLASTDHTSITNLERLWKSALAFKISSWNNLFHFFSFLLLLNKSRGWISKLPVGFFKINMNNTYMYYIYKVYTKMLQKQNNATSRLMIIFQTCTFENIKSALLF